MDSCHKCMKIFLIAFNLILLLAGGVVLGFGIYALVQDSNISQMVSFLGSNVYLNGLYIMVTAGSLTILISFLGCCGALREHRPFLCLYIISMILVIVLLIAICVIGLTFHHQISERMISNARNSLVFRYGKIDVDTYHWDSIQKTAKCCGVTGDVNSNTSWAIYKLESAWFRKQSENKTYGLGRQFVPISCCNEDVDQCIGVVGADGRIPKDGPPTSDAVSDNPFLYVEGCFSKIKTFLEHNSNIIIGIGIFAISVMVADLVFSICLCTQFKKKNYYV